MSELGKSKGNKLDGDVGRGLGVCGIGESLPATRAGERLSAAGTLPDKIDEGSRRLLDAAGADSSTGPLLNKPKSVGIGKGVVLCKKLFVCQFFLFGLFLLKKLFREIVIFPNQCRVVIPYFLKLPGLLFKEFRECEIRRGELENGDESSKCNAKS